MGFSYPYRNNSNKSSVPPITPVAPLPNIQLPITSLPVIPITSTSTSSTAATAAATDSSNPNNKFKSLPNTNVKRKRTAQACNACRRKRIKCDGKSPCTPCIQHKTESECCFAQPLKRGPRKGSTRVNLKERLHKVEELLLALTSKQNLDDKSLELLAKTVTENSKSKANSKTSSSTSTTTVKTNPIVPAKKETAALPSVTPNPSVSTSASLLSQKAASLLQKRNSLSTPTATILPNTNSNTSKAASSLLSTNPSLAAAAVAAATAGKSNTALVDSLASNRTNSLLNALQANTSSSINNNNNNNSKESADNSVSNLSNIINQSLLNSLILNQQQQISTLKGNSDKSLSPSASNTETMSALNALSQQLGTNLPTTNTSQLLALASQGSLNNGVDLLNPQNQVNLLTLAALQNNDKLKNNLSSLATKGNVNTVNSLNTSAAINEDNRSPFQSVLPTMNPSPKSLLETSIPLSPSLTLKNNKRKAKSNKQSTLANKKLATSLYKDQLTYNQENIINLTNNNKISSLNTINTKMEEEILNNKIKSIGVGEKNEIPFMSSNNSITIPSYNSTSSNIPSSTSAITSSIYKNLINNSKKEKEVTSSSTSESSVSNLPFIKVSSQTPVLPPTSLLSQSSNGNGNGSSKSPNNLSIDLLKNQPYSLFDANNKIDLDKNLNTNKSSINEGSSGQQLKLQELIQNSFKQLTKNATGNEELLSNNPLYNQLLLNSNKTLNTNTNANTNANGNTKTNISTNGDNTPIINNNSFVNATDSLNSNLGSFDIPNSLISPNATLSNINSSYIPSSENDIENILINNNIGNLQLNSSVSPTTTNINNVNSLSSKSITSSLPTKLNSLVPSKTSPLISQNGLTIPSDNSSFLIPDNNKNTNMNVSLDFLNTLNNANSLNTLNINNLYRSKILNSFNPMNPLNPLNQLNREGLNENVLMYNLNPELLQNYPISMAMSSGKLDDNIMNNKSSLLPKKEIEDKKADEKPYKGDLGVAFIDMKSSGGYIYFGNSSCVGLASNLISGLSSDKKTASFSFDDLKNILASVSNRKEDGSDKVNSNSRVEDVTPITTKENFRKVLDLFFDNLHPIIPLFNRQAFTSLLDNDPDAPGYQLLLHCILAVVGKYIPKEELPKDLPSDISQLAFDWARSQLQKVFDIPSLPTVQALIILSTLAMSNPRSEMGYSTYTYTGTAVRMAHELGLHRDLMLRGQDHTLEEKNETRRAWVLLYILDRQSAIMTGRPMIIDDSDWDIPPPTIDSNETTEIEKATVQALSVRLELFEIVGEISRWSNAGKRKASQETDPRKKEKFVLLHQKKLTDWRNSIPEFLQWADPPYLYNDDNEATNNLNMNSNSNSMKTKTEITSTLPTTTATTLSNNQLKIDIKVEKGNKSEILNSNSNTEGEDHSTVVTTDANTDADLSKSPKDLVWTMFPLYLAAIYYRAQLALHVYSLTSTSVTPTVIESKNICASAAIYLTNIIISMMAITSEPHPLCSFFLAQLPTTIMTCISVQLFIVKSNNWTVEERHTATKAILNNIQLLKISKVQPLATYLYAYAKWIVRKANIEIKESDLESIDAMNANTTSSNLKSIYSSIYSSSSSKNSQTIRSEIIGNDLPLSTTKMSASPVINTNNGTSSSSMNFVDLYLLDNETDSISSSFKGKNQMNIEDGLTDPDNKNIPMTNNLQDDAFLKNYINNNDLFSTTNDFLDLIQEMNLGYK